MDGLLTFHRERGVASTGWWRSGHSGCELRLCGAFWGQRRWGGTPTGEQPAREAAPDTSWWLGWRQGCPGWEERGTESREGTHWRGRNLKKTSKFSNQPSKNNQSDWAAPGRAIKVSYESCPSLSDFEQHMGNLLLLQVRHQINRPRLRSAYKQPIWGS